MTVSRRLRFEVLRRDGHTCRYCGAKAPDVNLTVDHVVPSALGGSDEPSNLVTACAECNGGKSSISPDQPIVEDVADSALRWASAMRFVAEDRAQRRDELQEELDFFEERWDRWQYGPEDDRKSVPKDPGWDVTVKRWLAAGLTLDDLDALIDVAMQSKAIVREKWRYFAGCAWRELTEMQAEARRILEFEDSQDETQWVEKDRRDG